MFSVLDLPSCFELPPALVHQSHLLTPDYRAACLGCTGQPRQERYSVTFIQLVSFNSLRTLLASRLVWIWHATEEE